MMHQMRILSRAGHQTVTWDPANAAEVKIAEKAFVASLANGSWAYQVKADETYEQMPTFDPAATTVMVLPPMAGG